MYDTADPETAERKPVGPSLDDLLVSKRLAALSPTPLPVTPFLRLAGDGDDDGSEQHICRGID